MDCKQAESQQESPDRQKVSFPNFEEWFAELNKTADQRLVRNRSLELVYEKVKQEFLNKHHRETEPDPTRNVGLTGSEK